MSNTMVSYDRRNKRGIKHTEVHEKDYNGTVTDFAADLDEDGKEILGAFASISIHAHDGRFGKPEAEVRATAGTGYVCIHVGGAAGVRLFLGVDQAQTLHASLAEAIYG